MSSIRKRSSTNASPRRRGRALEDVAVVGMDRIGDVDRPPVSTRRAAPMIRPPEDEDAVVVTGRELLDHERVAARPPRVGRRHLGLRRSD